MQYNKLTRDGVLAYIFVGDTKSSNACMCNQIVYFYLDGYEFDVCSYFLRFCLVQIPFDPFSTTRLCVTLHSPFWLCFFLSYPILPYTMELLAHSFPPSPPLPLSLSLPSLFILGCYEQNDYHFLFDDS